MAAMKSSAASSPEIVQMILQASCNAVPSVCGNTPARLQASYDLIMTDSASRELTLSSMSVTGEGASEKVLSLMQLLKHPPMYKSDTQSM